MKICALIVTYNDRFNLLNQVIESLLDLEINKIIVVDNNSNENSKNKIIQLEKRISNKLKVISLTENTGSAGGYAAGLKKFYEDNSCDFVWLLDDDNVPEKKSVEELKFFWSNLNKPNKETSIALLSYRVNREIYKKAIIDGDQNLTVGKINGFLGFNAIASFQKLIKSNIQRDKVTNKNLIKTHGNVSAAYYGGLFFHKDLLNNIGYPLNDFFVYSDDIEFTSRITRKGGEIILLLNSRLKDIDDSWAATEKKIPLLNLPVPADHNKERLYYQIRNRIYFEKYFWSSNSFLYSINKIIYLSFLKIVFLMNDLPLKKIIEKAVTDGLNDNLGKKEKSYFEL